jgi:hypothetical protein
MEVIGALPAQGNSSSMKLYGPHSRCQGGEEEKTSPPPPGVDCDCPVFQPISIPVTLQDNMYK